MNTTNSQNGQPATLQQAILHFADLDVCHAYMAKIKWPDGIVCCPECGNIEIGVIKSRRMFQCKAKACRKQFSVKVGTILEDSPLGLDKWFVAVWCITNDKNGISSCEVARALGVTQKTAWFMLHRVRHAMQVGSFDKMTGEVEADETFIGGKAKNMHLSRRRRVITGGGGVNKTAVMGLLERHDGKKHSTVRAEVVPNVRRETLHSIIHQNVEPGSAVYTDAHHGYKQLDPAYFHDFVDHVERYVKGAVHTNGLENFWSLLKRTIGGTYVSVDAPHLDRYVAEQAFRFNERKTNDAGRFASVMPGVVGKRLMYKTLIGANTPDNCKKDEAGDGGLAN